MNSNHNDDMQKMIDAYLNGSLSLEERTAFEKQIDTDQALKEELLIYKALQESFNENDWHTLDKSKNKAGFLEIKKELKSETSQNISQHIRTAETDYFNNKHKQKTKPKRFYALAIAASIILFVSIGFPYLFGSENLEDYYNTYQDWETIPSLTEKGSESPSQKIEAFFDSKDYNAIINYYNSSSNIKETIHPYTLLKVGNAYFYNANYNKAIETFNAFIALDTMESSKGYWYKLLVYLKIEDKDKAIEQLDIILQDENNYKYKEAKEIADKIK